MVRACQDALLAQIQSALAHLMHVKIALHNCENGIVALVQYSIGKGWKSYEMQQCTSDPLERCCRFGYSSLQCTGMSSCICKCKALPCLKIMLHNGYLNREGN